MMIPARIRTYWSSYASAENYWAIDSSSDTSTAKSFQDQFQKLWDSAFLEAANKLKFVILLLNIHVSKKGHMSALS